MESLEEPHWKMASLAFKSFSGTSVNPQNRYVAVICGADSRYGVVFSCKISKGAFVGSRTNLPTL